MIASPQILKMKKCPTDTKPGQLGHDRANTRRFEGDNMDRRQTSLRRQTTVVRPTTVVRRISARETAESFAIAARGYTPRQLADAADTTIEAAKFWLDAKRAPNSANLLNMARTLPFVVDWFMAESAAGNRAAQANSSDGVLQSLRAFAKLEGPESDVARAILDGISGSKP